MLDMNLINYFVKKDLEFLMDSENLTIEQIADTIDVSRTTLHSILNNEPSMKSIYEKIYSLIYRYKYRLNSVKEEIIKEMTKDIVLFHGSKKGLDNIDVIHSRNTCDFGRGFYLGETYENALSFVCENELSSVYSFTCDLKKLKVLRFDCTIEWMLAICYFRGTIKEYEKKKMILDIIEKIESADVIIAPIADNKMFYIMNLFANGEINAEVALHSLSASKLGLQYVFKTRKSLKYLKPIEKYYLCSEEKKECIKRIQSRSEEIDTKLKLSRREFRNGLYIEELIK